MTAHVYRGHVKPDTRLDDVSGNIRHAGLGAAGVRLEVFLEKTSYTRRCIVSDHSGELVNA